MEKMSPLSEALFNCFKPADREKQLEALKELEQCRAYSFKAGDAVQWTGGEESVYGQENDSDEV